MAMKIGGEMTKLVVCDSVLGIYLKLQVGQLHFTCSLAPSQATYREAL